MSAPLTLIAPDRPAGAAGWRDLWAFRELLYFLVWRDLKVRYKQTVFGAAWALLQPLATMVVFAVFFGRLAQMPSDGIPYPLFAYAALVPWTYFASALTTGALSLVGSQHLISKVFFPRLLIPLASVITPLFDALIALALMAVLLPWYGFGVRMAMLMLPLFAILMVGDCTWRRAVAGGAQREVPGCPLSAAVLRPVLVVPHTCHLSRLARARGVALRLWHQPDGHSGRGLSLEPRRICRPASGDGRGVGYRDDARHWRRCVVFQAHGGRVCRCHLSRCSRPKRSESAIGWVRHGTIRCAIASRMRCDRLAGVSADAPSPMANCYGRSAT